MYTNRKPLLRVCPDCNKTEPWHKPSTKVCEPCRKIRRQKKRKLPQINAHVGKWNYHCAQLKKKVSCLTCRCEVSFTACLECGIETPKCACYRPSHNSKTGSRHSCCYACVGSYNQRISKAYSKSPINQPVSDEALEEAIKYKWYRYVTRLGKYKIPQDHIRKYKHLLINKFNMKRCRDCMIMYRVHSYSTTKCIHCSQDIILKYKQDAKRARIKRRAKELQELHNHCDPCQDGQYVYIMTDGIHYKVGISKNPHERMRELMKKQRATNLSVIGIYKALTIRAIDTERVIHKQLSPFNISYQYPSGVTSIEWFDVPLQLLMNCVTFHAVEMTEMT
jgi:hypothetical protein